MRRGLFLIGWLAASFAVRAAEEHGVGLALAKHPGGFQVTAVLTNSPAALSGSIQKGDLITAVAQDSNEPSSLENLEFVGQAVGMIRGPIGTVVRLTVVPDATNTAQTKVVSLVRGELKGVPLGGLWLNVLTNGAPAPDVELVRLPGKQKERLTSHRGKIVVLDFWATWCGPCLKLIPEIQNHAQRLSARKDIIWITVALDEKPDTAETRLRSNGWTTTHNTWAEQSVAKAFGVGSLPRLYVIDRQGKVI